MRGGHVDAVTRTHVAGWAADSEQPDRALGLCILVDDQESGRIVANRPRRDIAALGRFGNAGHGFHFAFPRALTAGAAHKISVRYADTMAVLPNGEHMLAQDPDEAVGHAAALVPILVSAPGRSGTTYLMRCLAGSPQVVAATVVPYEVRLLAYYATAFSVLTAPGDLARSTHPDRLEGDGFHVGFNPFTAPQYTNVFHTKDAMASFQDDWLPGQVGIALSGIIQEYYRRLAADQAKHAVTMFAEKNNNLNEPTRRFVRRAFPACREIAIVRDPRDVLCSHMAYFSSSQEKAFLHLSHSCRQLARLHEKAAEDICFVRYEDMIRGDPATFANLSAFLDAAVEPEVSSADNAMFRSHGTSQSPAASIGRWRRDLPEAMRTQSSAVWAGFLERFGYDKPL